MLLLMTELFTENHKNELEEKGYTIIENVLNHDECDDKINKMWKPVK